MVWGVDGGTHSTSAALRRGPFARCMRPQDYVLSCVSAGSLVTSSPSSVFPSSYTLARTSDTPYSYSLTLKNLALLLQVTLQGVLAVPKEPIDLFPYKKE